MPLHKLRAVWMMTKGTAGYSPLSPPLFSHRTAPFFKITQSRTMNRHGKITLLMFVFSICATAALLHYYTAPSAPRQRPTELYEVVQRQYEAFRQNNLSSAYSQVSTSFQQTWTLDQFTNMVRNDCARIAKAERVEFGPWQRRGRQVILQVFFVNADGTVAPCIYTLVSEGDRWKIDNARWVKGWQGVQRMRGIRT